VSQRNAIRPVGRTGRMGPTRRGQDGSTCFRLLRGTCQWHWALALVGKVETKAPMSSIWFWAVCAPPAPGGQTWRPSWRSAFGSAGFIEAIPGLRAPGVEPLTKESNPG